MPDWSIKIVSVKNPKPDLKAEFLTVTTTNGNGVQPKYVAVLDDKFDKATQCLLNLQDKSTWHDCHNSTSNAPRIWWDVFPIPSGKIFNNVQVPGYFLMRSRFADFPGQYVMHCHILAHEDRGMMATISLEPANAPQAQMLYRHH